MLKLEIALNEQKIIDDGKYDLIGLYNCLDNIFIKNGIKVLEVSSECRCYTDTGKKTDLANMFQCIFYLEKQSWFTDYVSKWLLYNSYNSESETDCEVVDIIAKNNLRRESVAV